MSARKPSENFTMSKIRDKVNSKYTDAQYSRQPNKGKAVPKLVKLTEAALTVAFFVVVNMLKLYYWTYSRTEQFRWHLLLTMQTLRDRKKSGG